MYEKKIIFHFSAFLSILLNISFTCTVYICCLYLFDMSSSVSRLDFNQIFVNLKAAPSSEFFLIFEIEKSIFHDPLYCQSCSKSNLRNINLPFFCQKCSILMYYWHKNRNIGFHAKSNSKWTILEKEWYIYSSKMNFTQLWPYNGSALWRSGKCFSLNINWGYC